MRKTPYNYIVPKVSKTVDFGKAPIECTECITYCQEGHIDIPCKGTFDCEDREEMKKETKESKIVKTIDNLPSCNSCAHNGTWDCIKCKGFDKYEK